MTRDLTVYIGAAWYQHCDPCLSVVYVGLTLAQADKAFRRAMRDHERWANNDGNEQERDSRGRFLPYPSLYWSGRVYPESLRDILSHMNRETRRCFLQDLRTGSASPEI